MSKLLNAPLIEVIFELRWEINLKSDLIDFQYLHGDLYSSLKDKYPHRENLIPPEIPFEAVKGMPVFRFRETNNSYPLIQIGPGLLTVNALNDSYVWSDFKQEIYNVLDVLNQIYPKINTLNLKPGLTYIDFLSMDKKAINSIDFINENLNVAISNTILTDAQILVNDINFTVNYKIKENLLSLNVADGKVNDNTDGIILQTKVIGNNNSYNNQELKSWLEGSHELSSKTFKSIIKEELYNSFK